MPPPEDEKGVEVGDASAVRVPATSPVSGDPKAVLFVPEGVGATEDLKVRVVKLKPKAMGAVIQRRC